MKKVLLALFLMSGFVSADFSITDESGTQTGPWVNLELNIPVGSAHQYYNVNITDLSSGNTFIFENNSQSNILLRFNAGVTSKRQVIYQVGTNRNSFSSDYYALSSCEVDKSTNNRPTRSFFIINKKQTKLLKFYLRDCDTGDIINNGEKLNLETTLLAINTQMRDNSDSKGQNDTSKDLGLPTVIIGKKATRYLSTRSATGKDEFLCGTTNNIQSLELYHELYDGSDRKIDNLNPTQVAQDQKGTRINFTIENRPGTNYRKMYFKLTCDGGQDPQYYYFDARPKQIVVKLPNTNEWLYAEYKYKIDGTTYDDEFSKTIKEQKDFSTKCDNCKVVANQLLESKTMNRITLTPVDANGVVVTDYNSIAEIVIAGKIYGDGTNAISGSSDANIINETSGNNLIRPCVAGSRAGCEIALAEINGDTKSEIYTDIINNQKFLAYNNVGPTMLYGVDTEWTKYSQTYIAEASSSSQVSTLCDKFESHPDEKDVTINGKKYSLVGCNIPFVAEDGSDLNFYSFKPALYKMLFESKNSPANESYGTDKLTYIHTIKPGDYDDANDKIFEAADFNASILAIGASLESLKNNRALSHYDNHLKVANKLKFSGNPANPTITIEGTSTQNDIAADFKKVTVNNDETDISDAIMLTLEPNNPYNHQEGYKADPTSTDITTDKNNIDINMPKNNFYAGKNTEVNKLNLKREDLLARSYAHIGSSTLDINISNSNNADLINKITNDKAAFISSYKGDDLNFVDAAIIAPNIASNDETTTNGAVYLAGYCESTSLTACKEIKVFISSAIAGHINYYGFDFLAYGNTGATDGLFEYSGATFSQFKRGADFLNSFEADKDKVTIMLKGDKLAEEYCNIFRNCYPLENGKFGTTFKSYKASIRQWHGGGDEQGKTIVDNITTDGKTTRRKEQRLSF